jgi:hypothetical protein
VRRLALGLGLVAAAVAAVLAVVALATGAPRGRLVDGYVLFVGALVLFGLVRATRAAAPWQARSAFDEARRARPRPPERPRELAKLEREVVLAATSAFDVHFRLRPLLRDVAEHRLASRRGLDLDSGSASVRAALGSERWEIVRPDRPPPRDRLAPGLSLPRLRAAVDVLERI